MKPLTFILLLVLVGGCQPKQYPNHMPTGWTLERNEITGKYRCKSPWDDKVFSFGGQGYVSRENALRKAWECDDEVQAERRELERSHLIDKSWREVE